MTHMYFELLFLDLAADDNSCYRQLRLMQSMTLNKFVLFIHVC